jgi:hypothetical protein
MAENLVKIAFDNDISDPWREELVSYTSENLKLHLC